MHHIILSMNEKNTEENFCGKIVLIPFFLLSPFLWNLYSHMMPFMWPIVCIFFAVKREHYVHSTFVFNFPIHLKEIIYACIKKNIFEKCLKLVKEYKTLLLPSHYRLSNEKTTVKSSFKRLKSNSRKNCRQMRK